MSAHSTKVKWLLPLLLILLIAPFSSTIDLETARFFFREGKFFENSFTAFLFKYGELIGFVFGGFATLIFFLSKKWRRGALILILTLVLGAGLCINTLLKEHWGRPRPKQLTEFGGKLDFRPFYAPNFDRSREPQKSFPSGHVAIGFYYLSLCVVARRYKNLTLFILGVSLTLFFGFGLFFSRIAQGGHFVSDALFSMVIMWYAALLAERVVWRERNVTKTPA